METRPALVSTASWADVSPGRLSCYPRPLQMPQPGGPLQARGPLCQSGPFPQGRPLMLTFRPLTAQQRRRTLRGAVTQPSSRSLGVNRQA